MFLLFPTLIFLYSKQRYLADKACLNEPSRRQSKFLTKDAYRFLAPTFSVFLSHLLLIYKKTKHKICRGPRMPQGCRAIMRRQLFGIVLQELWYCITKNLVLYCKNNIGIVLPSGVFFVRGDWRNER